MPTPYGKDFKSCVANVSGWAENPEGFCAWVERGDNGGDPKGVRFRCADCDALAPVCYGGVRADGGERQAVYADHAGKDGPCPGSGKPLHVPNSRTDSPTERVRRFDKVDPAGLAKPERLANGWLRVDGRIARVGVQEYADANGVTHRELRPPDEVFAPAAVASFRQVPVTNTHPPVLLDASNAIPYTKGAVGDVRQDDAEWLAGSLLIYDSETIAYVEAGREQLSCGYTCVLDPRPGVWRGLDGKGSEERYDFVQREIRGNHLAAVDQARAGGGARLRLDSRDAAAVGLNPQTTTETRTMPQEIRVDGRSIELTETNARLIQQEVDRALERAKLDGAKPAQEKLDGATRSRKSLIHALALVCAQRDADKEMFAAKKHDLMTCPECGGKGEVKGDDDAAAKCDYCDGKGKVSALGEFGGKELDDDGDGDDDMELEDADELEVEQETEKEAQEAHKDSARRFEKFCKDSAARVTKRDQAVANRVRRDARDRGKLEAQAREVLGADAKLDKLDVVGVHKAVLAKITPALKTDGMAPAEIAARYDVACALAKEGRTDGGDRVRASVLTPSLPQRPSGSGIDAAIKKMDGHAADAWKNPAPTAAK